MTIKSTLISIGITSGGLESSTYAVPVFSANAFYRWPIQNGLGRYTINGKYVRCLKVKTVSQMAVNPSPCARKQSCIFDGNGGLVTASQLIKRYKELYE